MRFAGYAALFDRPDRGGDVVRAGAFERSLKRGPAAVPLLLQHRTGRPVGRIEYLREDRRGLRVIARLSDGRAGQAAAALLREGRLAGLSFGYKVKKASAWPGPGPSRLRELTELELLEISLVAVPMQPKARVHALAGGAQASPAGATRVKPGTGRSSGPS
ncbi:MAG TPA: HK97 family phage prohead protease [Allosphingosinicella sp.]|jgi:hypothetical protein